MAQDPIAQPTNEAPISSEKPHAEPTNSEESSRVAGAESAAPGPPPESAEPARPPLPARPSQAASLPSQAHPRQAPPHQPYHQHQQPYAPYPYPPQVYAYPQAPRVLPPYSKSWTLGKLVLTTLSLVWAIVIFCLSLVFLSQGSYASGLSLYALPISIVAICWNSAEFVTFCARARSDTKRGIHPGAHVGLHLCLWIVSVFGILLTSLNYIGIVQEMEYCSEDNDVYRSSSSYYCSDYRSAENLYMNGFYLPCYRALMSMWCLAALNHFVLFVIACIDTHRRNRLKPAGIVYAQPAVYGHPPPAGMVPYYPMQPQQAHFPPAPGAPAVPAVPGNQPEQAAQTHQNLAGFYAPLPVPALNFRAPAPAPAPAPPSPTRAQAPSDADAITPAPPAQSTSHQ